MKVAFWARGVRRPAAEDRAARAVRRALATGGVRAGEVNVIWTGRDALRRMNRRFRGKDRFTDVISFRYAGPGRRGTPFGDLYISPEQARINARRFRVPFPEEIVRLAAHGALHLLGYTDYTPGARARMWRVQEPVVRRAMEKA